MKIGELAKETQVSVRMLHHYDEIGLLKPTDRSETGHRLYTKEDIQRLQKIITLRGVGLSLEQIKQVLGEPPPAVLDTVDRRIEAIETEIEDKTRTLQKLKTAKELLTHKNELTVPRIIEAIRSVGVFEGHLSKEELIHLAKQDAALTKQGLPDFETQVKALVKEFQLLMQKDFPPCSPEAQDTIKRWRELSELMTQGNEDMKNRLRQMKEAKPGVIAQLGDEVGITRLMIEYMKEASESLKA